MSEKKITLGAAIDQIVAALESLEERSRLTAIHAACDFLSDRGQHHNVFPGKEKCVQGERHEIKTSSEPRAQFFTHIVSGCNREYGQ